MELRTKISAEPGRQDLVITREFGLPVELLFRAYTEAEIVEQWMSTKVLKLENRRDGAWQFETTDGKGNKYRFRGVIHEFTPNAKIIRTFEMENPPSGVQLEFLDFEVLDEDRSKLTVHAVYISAAQRDQMLQRSMAQGINMAHNRLQTIASQLK